MGYIARPFRRKWRGRREGFRRVTNYRAYGWKDSLRQGSSADLMGPYPCATWENRAKSPADTRMGLVGMNRASKRTMRILCRGSAKSPEWNPTNERITTECGESSYILSMGERSHQGSANPTGPELAAPHPIIVEPDGFF